MLPSHAKYIIRFDDICSTMHWKKWEPIERGLVELGIKPLLAVVPDNQDAKLKVADAHPSFWSKVREWQARGWTIGLHGYQHLYHTSSSGILGINSRSEFAGLSLDTQEIMLQKGCQIFRMNGVEPAVWVAPAHSFDGLTLVALARQGISVVSDGISLFPVRGRYGTIWVPQQFSRLRQMPMGIWTTCYHVNNMSDGAIEALLADLIRFKSRITTVEVAVAEVRDRGTILDLPLQWARWGVLQLHQRRSD